MSVFFSMVSSMVVLWCGWVVEGFSSEVEWSSGVVEKCSGVV